MDAFGVLQVNAWDYRNKPGTAQTIEVEAMCDMSQAGDSFTAYDHRNSSPMQHSLRRNSSTESIMVGVVSTTLFISGVWFNTETEVSIIKVFSLGFSVFIFDKRLYQ